MINKINSLNNVKVENYEDLNEALNKNNEDDNEENQVANNQAENNQAANNQVENNQAANNQVANNQVANNQEANNQVENNQVANNSKLPKGMDDSAESKYADIEWKPTNEEPEEVNNLDKNSLDEINLLHPASSTMTDNLLAKNAKKDENGPTGLTTWQNLYDASENAVPGADIMSQVLSQEGTHSAQGMNHPIGYNYSRHDGWHGPCQKENGFLHEQLRNNKVLDKHKIE